MAHQNHEYHEYIVEQTEKVIGIDSRQVIITMYRNIL